MICVHSSSSAFSGVSLYSLPGETGVDTGR